MKPRKVYRVMKVNKGKGRETEYQYLTGFNRKNWTDVCPGPKDAEDCYKAIRGKRKPFTCSTCPYYQFANNWSPIGKLYNCRGAANKALNRVLQNGEKAIIEVLECIVLDYEYPAKEI